MGSDVHGIRSDVFWSATTILPYGLPKRLPKVITLLDVVWRDHPDTMSAMTPLASGLERGLHQADRIACISAFTRDRLIEHWPELSDRALVVPLAARIAVENDARIGGARPYILNVDTLEPRKNHAILLDALRWLPDLQFVQCGRTGWGVTSVLERARSLPRVTLRGYVSESELDSLYRGAIAAVFPSIYEGFHLPALDALSAGCPVIASDIPVHREVLGEAAIFVPCHDAEAWAAAIRRVRDEPELGVRMSRAGRQRALAFSWDRSAEKLLHLFDSINRG